MKTVPTILLLLPIAVFAAATNELPSLVPPCADLKPTFLEDHKTAIVLSVFAIASITTAAVWNWRRRGIGPVLPPGKIARDALRILLEAPETGETVSASSQILRTYIGRRFNLPGRVMTTTEFCKAIGAHPQIRSESARAITCFLGECDVRKFSPANTAAPFDAANRVLDFIEDLESDLEAAREIPGNDEPTPKVPPAGPRSQPAPR